MIFVILIVIALALCFVFRKQLATWWADIGKDFDELESEAKKVEESDLTPPPGKDEPKP